MGDDKMRPFDTVILALIFALIFGTGLGELLNWGEPRPEPKPIPAPENLTVDIEVAEPYTSWHRRYQAYPDHGH